MKVSGRQWRGLVWGMTAGAALVALVYVAWMAMFVWAMSSPCGYEVQQEAVSPDHRQKAAVVEVNCGATTPYMDWAVIAPSGRSYDFQKDEVATAHGREMRVAWEGPKLVVFWHEDPYHPGRPATLRQGAEKSVELRKF